MDGLNMALSCTAYYGMYYLVVNDEVVGYLLQRPGCHRVTRSIEEVATDLLQRYLVQHEQ